ncbi:drug ABC transporter, ATP-binding/permease [Clostridium putrefaciens]|uniref:Drug ABC transporter, ATP-binding/permease n=1 Tax=Clostridium putrefaciens TaxID=99675 RepID=A0A381JAW8_9CLOT|nr:ABC transporter permease [Clostridium putrefaciens]SUY47547.1 drug ABC transporter, ATP-binding/permease [Clostridium putrefaciens]
MVSIFKISRRILKQSFRKKSNIITFLLLPIIGVFVALVFNTTKGTTIKVGICNLDIGHISKDMINTISTNKKFEIIDLKQEDINNLVSNNVVDCALVIPGDFSDSIYNNKFDSIKIVTMQGKEITAWIENDLNYYISNLTDISKVSEGDKEMFDKIYSGYKDQKLKLNSIKLNDESINKGVTKSSIGYLMLFMMLGSSVTANCIIKDKENRTYFRIFCSPISKVQYVFSNVLASLLIILMQIAVILIISIGIFKLNFYINIGTLIIILVSFGLVSIGFGIIMAAFSKSTAQSSQISNIFILPTCMLSGCLWPIEFMPKFLQSFANIFPQTWVLKAVEDLQHGMTLWEVQSYIWVTIAFAFLFFIIGIIEFKRDENLKRFV